MVRVWRGPRRVLFRRSDVRGGRGYSPGGRLADHRRGAGRRSVIRLDGRTLLRVLLAAFGGSFFLLYGWYFLLTGMDWGFLY